MMGHEMTNGGHEMMMGGSHGMMDGMGTAFFGFLLLAALLLFAVVAGAILLVRALWKPQNQASHAETPSAFEILEQRYARETSTTTSSTDDGGLLGRPHDSFSARRRAVRRYETHGGTEVLVASPATRRIRARG